MRRIRKKDKNLNYEVIGNKKHNIYRKYWKEGEKNAFKEKALKNLVSKYPGQSDLVGIYIKVSTLNDFYSTQIYDTYSAAKDIYSIKEIDDKIKNGDHGVVELIRSETIKDFYSFATKYCSLHNEDKFPIYDRYVADVLLYLRNIEKIDDFATDDLKDYKKYCEVIKQIKEKNIWGLGELNYKDIDMYLWAIGKEYFKQ